MVLRKYYFLVNPVDLHLIIISQQNIFKFPTVLKEETQQKLEISSDKTTRNGKFPFHTSEIIGNCAFPLSFRGENSHEILIFFTKRMLRYLNMRLVMHHMQPAI